MRDFVYDLVEAFPALQPLLSEHLAFNDELLTHLVMGDFAGWATSKGSRSLDDPELIKLLTYLENRYPPADLYVQNLIDVSFIENLGYDSAIPTRFGPKLRQAHKELWESMSRRPDEPPETTEPRRPWWRGKKL